MKFGYREDCLDHDTGDRHPERPERLRAIRRRLVKCHDVEYCEGAPADREALEAVHDPDFVDSIESFCADGGGVWDADTVGSEGTWAAALASAGLARWAVEAALDGADGRETPFSIGRPPGHHAEADRAMGFCFFNNAAVAAAGALRRDDVDRVAVVDWDVHHGNGTQEIFYDDESVFYASIHERGLFPGSGRVEETGGPAAPRTTLNVPFPGQCGDAEYAAAFEEAILPGVERFDPDLVVVSAGFDAHRTDHISRARVSTEGFGHLTDRVRALADRTDAALALVLEGGYVLDALSDSVAMVHEVFGGREPETPDGDASSDARRVIDEVRDAHDL